MLQYRVVSRNRFFYGPVDNEKEAKELLDYHTKWGPAGPYYLEVREVTKWKKLERG